MDVENTQGDFFDHIKSTLPGHISLVDTISELLHISNDSAYRRIRGEKQLSLEEIRLLCGHFRISLDRILAFPGNNLLFSGRYIRPESFHFSSYLNGMLDTFRYIRSCREKEIFYLTKDYPIYHYFMFPDIASFKYFFWMKTYLNFPEFNRKKFVMEHFMDEMKEKGTAVASHYTKINSTEILNPDNVLTTLRQLEYYKESQFFEQASDLERIYDSMSSMINHMEEQAEAGKKFMFGQRPGSDAGQYNLYVNDFFIGDNTHLVKLEDKYTCYLVHNGINYLTTSDPAFCTYTRSFVDKIIRKSALISIVGEKERTTFFNLIREKIKAYRESKVNTLANF